MPQTRYWLDCDYSGAHSRYAKWAWLAGAKRDAADMLRDVAEGQIGIFESCMGGNFHGYMIKLEGQDPFFEPARNEDAGAA